MLLQMFAEVRFAVRQLRRAPGYALTVGLTVALAIGAVAALTGVLRATLWSSLPYPAAEQLYRLSDRNMLDRAKAGGLIGLSRFEEAAALETDGKRVFASAGQFYLNPTAVGVAGQEPRAVQQAGVSNAFFATVGSRALLGSTLRAEDNVRGAPLRLVISYGLWQSLFAGDPKIVGRVVRLGSDQGTVVGVMGQQFALPTGVDVWTAGHMQAAQFGGYRGEGTRFVNAIVRLQPGERPVDANAALKGLAEQLAGRFPASDAAYAFEMVGLRDSIFGPYRRALALVAVSVGILLVVVVLNVCGLQVTRSVARQPEFAIRAALGVTELRLLRQIVTENLVLLSAAGAAGLYLAVVFLRLLLARVPRGLLAVSRPHMDTTVGALAAVLCLGVSLMTALVSWKVSQRRRQTQAPLVSAERVVPTQAIAVGRVLAVMQTASAFVLLALSVSVLSELYRLLRTPLGFATAHVQTFTIDKGWNGDPAKLHALYQQIEQQLGAVPGVRGVGAMSALPLNTFSFRGNFDVEGRPLTPRHDTVSAESRNVTPGLLSALQIPLLAGRPLLERDGDANAPHAVLVNHSLAVWYFGGSGAVGQRLLMQGGLADKTLVPAEIVGVIGDVKTARGSITDAGAPEVYSPENGGWPHMQFAVRSDVELPGLESRVRAMLASLDAGASIGKMGTLEGAVHEAQRQPALNAELLTVFAGFGVVLVMLGVYGLAAFNLSQRVREFAVRMALGSSREAVFGLMLRDAVRVLLWGLPLGVLGVVLGGRLLRATVFAATPVPVWTYPAAALLLAVCALGATLQPARRAARLEPMEALRAE